MFIGNKNINGYYTCFKHIDISQHVVQCPQHKIPCDQFILEFGTKRNFVFSEESL